MKRMCMIKVGVGVGSWSGRARGRGLPRVEASAVSSVAVSSACISAVLVSLLAVNSDASCVSGLIMRGSATESLINILSDIVGCGW